MPDKIFLREEGGRRGRLDEAMRCWHLSQGLTGPAGTARAEWPGEGGGGGVMYQKHAVRF